VIAVDSNILIYAHREDSPFHQPAFGSLSTLADRGATWAIPWPCLHEFVSIVTNPRVYRPATPIEIAFKEVDAWLESPGLVFLAETDRHLSELRKSAVARRVSGPLIHDARIAALCRQHGVTELWSADRDFSRFPDLKVVNPLVR
jgi:toxin-antitoxin system PIN domain toxin